MSRLRLDIESLVLDGFPMDASQGRRLAALTEAALERLLRERGLSPAFGGADKIDAKVKTAQIKTPPGANEHRCAEELAEALYRLLDRGQ